MKKEEVVYCGIDVAKSHLDIALCGERWRVANTQTGIGGLVERLKAAAPKKLQVICEASGGYEQALLGALPEAAVAGNVGSSQSSAPVCSCLWHFS